ncbi:Eisosome component PIL1-domain-containing protein [Aspergillus pseudodeflectus]|uniref:Eisosome component PIL1-domain-containing protein n=1 Tax=Aspergillus pseudodeflectus TaxID=176178 RepID=A0ABR4L3F5_9EURO
MNRTLSGRRRSSTNTGRHRFSISTFRGLQQPLLSKKMNRVIKSENAAIAAHESAARQRLAIAAQLSEWGETTQDEAISDISDKLGVLMAEMGEQEDLYALNLEEYRSILKHIRDTESSVQPTRDQRTKIAEDIQKLKLKEPNSHRIETLEQELVRAEAQNLVAEAQLTNVTRQRFKEALHVNLAAVIERGEKQALLARHARRLLNCLDDTPVIPGDEPKEYAHGDEAKQIIEDAERELHSWESNIEPVETGAGAAPAGTSNPSSAREVRGEAGTESQATESVADEPEDTQAETVSTSDEGAHIAVADMASPHARVHSMSAPMMDADALEEQSPSATTPKVTGMGVTGGEAQASRSDNVNGSSETQANSAPHITQASSGNEMNFPIRTKKTESYQQGGALYEQVQRVAVPI